MIAKALPPQIGLAASGLRRTQARNGALGRAWFVLMMTFARQKRKHRGTVALCDLEVGMQCVRLVALCFSAAGALICSSGAQGQTAKEMTECLDRLQDFKKSPDAPRTKKDLEELKRCLKLLEEADRRPASTIFRKS